MNTTPRIVRWLVGVAIGLASALSLFLLIVQLIVSQTDVARRRVEATLTARSGWRTHIGAIDVGWLGSSVLRDVEVWLPLQDKPALVAPRLVVGHRELLGILLGRDTAIHSLEFHQPTLAVLENAAGRWNIQEAIQLWLEAAARRRSDPSAPVLPALDFRDGTVIIRRADGREATLPFSFSAAAHRADMAATLRVPGVIDAEARIAPDAAWTHEARVTIHDASPVAALFMDAPPAPITARGIWRATVRPGDLRGEAEIHDLTYAGQTARGRLFLTTGGERTRIRAEGLAIAGDRIPSPPLLLRAGELELPSDGGPISVSSLVAEWLGTTVTVDGSWNPDQRSGEMRASWSGASGRFDIQQFGSLTVSAALPRAGLGRVQARLSARGRALGGRFSIDLDATAAGSEWTRFRTTLEATSLSWTDRDGPIDLSGLSTTVIVRWPVVRLTDLRAPPAHINAAAARYDAVTNEWMAELDLTGLTVPRSDVGQISISGEASGVGAAASVPRLVITTDPAELSASVAYDPAAPTPLAAAVTVASPPPPRGDLVVQPEPPPTGTWNADAQIEGSIQPLDLRAAGSATGAGIKAPGGELAPVRIDWSAHADTTGFRIRTDPFELLGGLWALRATWPADGPPRARVGVENLSLRQLADAGDVPLDVGGVLMAELTLTAHDWTTDGLELTGQWAVESPRAGWYGVERGRGLIRSRQGRVDIHDILFTLHEGELGGSVSFNLANANLLAVNVASRGWPVRIQGTDVGLTVDGVARATIDVFEGLARGDFDLAVPVTVAGVPYAEARTSGRIRGRTLHVDDLTADLGGGDVSGTLVLPLDAWHQMDLYLALNDLGVPELLAPWGGMSATAAEVATGRLTGLIAAAPSASTRALEPLRINILLSPDGTSFRGLTLGDSQLTMYAGPERVVLDDSFLNIGGGLVNLWSRLSWHNGQPFVHAQADVADLNLDALVHAIAPGAAPVPGKITGRFSAGTYLYEPRRMFGRATVLLEEADLANVNLVSRLYGLLSFRPEGLVPTGLGRATLRLEDYTLLIGEVEYFNRGVDIVGSGRVEDLRMGEASPVSGVAVARIRPLRDLRVGLPLISEVDELLAALQSGGASIVISGTVADRRLDRATEREIRQAVRRASTSAGP